jgi:hypothetical protein
MNYFILAVLLLNTITFAYKLNPNNNGLSTGEVASGQADEIFDDNELEAYRKLLAKKLSILTNYLKSSQDLANIQEKRGHIWKRST